MAVDMASLTASNKQHVFIMGSKGFSSYGGYETFVDKLTEYQENNREIQYHVACKANGQGFTDESSLKHIQKINDREFIYHNAHCVKFSVPEIGAAQAIYYDLSSLRYFIKYCEAQKIHEPVFYILACRIGIFIKHFAKQIHKLGGRLYINPDGHEWKRPKWPYIVRKYWKLSERLSVKYSDIVICDSINIEKYINSEYKNYNPRTEFISYGAELTPSLLKDDSTEFISWLKENNVKPFGYYLSVCRFVPENNFETMIREFMNSSSERDFVIITTENHKFFKALEKKLKFKADKRIKFTKAVYNSELLKKIRQNAFAYIHGHEFGGTNPSLLESMALTSLNLLLNVKFNHEVGEDAAIYWSKSNGSLSEAINAAEKMSAKEIENLGKKAQDRIRLNYEWHTIAGKYEKFFLQKK